MVWGAILYKRTLSMVGIESTLDAKFYFDVLKQGLLDEANTTLEDI